MTREEEIVNAARERAERHQIAEMELYGGDKCNYSYGRIYNSEISSFEAGVRWADEHPINMWHDASDIPNDDSLIIYESVYGDILLKLFTNRASAMANVLRWAYISDLLPKGGLK